MNQYVALIRGINVGGNSKVSMATLRECLESAGLRNVSTYINSGNIIFESSITDLEKLVTKIEDLLIKHFAVTTRVSVVSVNELHDAVTHAPAWWGEDSESKHNAIFVIAPDNVTEVMKEVGEAKTEYESIAAHKHVIFWSAPIKTFGRTRWSKIVGTTAYQKVTIRNYNTTKKLVELTS